MEIEKHGYKFKIDNSNLYSKKWFDRKINNGGTWEEYTFHILHP